ncbi:xylosidase/arabinosidase [Ephemerocybe angulata]|uniref:Xylosidase/arabinosidase n=1 Tax=Ephemerocybe angulata TaxID=980116 RepID=A0A8H6I6Q8_9AGAR|nr:xylosidase/arabinosidase [Tulosesus angulatus]
MPSSSTTGRVIKRANPETIHDKFLVGYQGWFTCAGDGEPVGPGHHGWLHWFDKPIPEGGRPNLDLWPDVSSYSEAELYPAPGLKMKSGEPAMLFSSRNAKTVQRHFHWMAEHGVDGAFLQRFAGQCDLEAGNEGVRRLRDEVGDRVREAAEREGRVFAIMYDVTGVPADRIQRVLEQDWMHLLHNKRILDSPNYLKEKRKPVVALWGFGFDNAGHTPALVASIAQFFRNATPGGVYLMGGTPTHWRTAEGDADRNPEFLNVWLNEFDAISPWTIGRYRTEEEADAFAETKMAADVELIKRHNEGGRSRRIDYIPVVFPGGSANHLSEGKWAFNDCPRKGGRFLWRQVFNARRAGAHIIYGAMWDEYDEGTAFMPAVANKRNLPVSDKWRFLALDEGGHDVPSDWYMRICGFAAEVLRGERRIFDSFPSKELQDYWSTRPKYETVPHKSADFVSGYAGASSTSAGSSSGAGSSRNTGDDPGQSYDEWLANQRTEVEEAPPPPYTMEVEELESAAPAPATQAPAVASAAPSTAAPQVQVQAPAHTTAPPVVVASGPPIDAMAHHRPPTASPPPVNYQSRPGQQQPYSQAPAPSNSTSPPPLHPNHPAAQSKPYGSSNTAQSLSSRRPPSSQGAPSIPPLPSAPPGSQGQSQGQWPPPEWGAGHAAAPPPPPSQYGQPGGASLTRPNTFSANSPSGGTITGPTELPATSSAYNPSAPAGTSNPAMPYGGTTPMQHHSSYVMPSGPHYNASAYPSMPGQPQQSSPYPPQNNYGGYHPGPPQHAGSMDFPGGPNAGPYPQYGGTSGAPSFPGSTGGPSPHTSPPITPGGSSSGYPNHSPSMFSEMPGGPSMYGSTFSQQQQQHPHAAGAGGEMGYYGNTTMPSGYPGGASSSAQYDNGISMPSSYQAGGSASAPMPWQPQQPGAPHAPSLPPRPSNYGSGSSYGPSSSAKPPAQGSAGGAGGFGFGPLSTTSGAAGSALGLALSAVDKVAGKKTTEQLMSGVGSLASCKCNLRTSVARFNANASAFLFAFFVLAGSKFFNKFTK